MDKKVYVLSICDDTPYHEGMEYWFSESINGILDILENEWDWMRRFEYNIYVCTLGKEDREDIDIIPRNPEDMDNDEIKDTDAYKECYKKYLEKYKGQSNIEQDKIKRLAKNDAIEQVKQDYKKGKFFDKLDKSTYEIYPEIENEIYVCQDCMVFYDKNEQCKLCGNEVKSTEDKVT